jgi:hypothetical protein
MMNRSRLVSDDKTRSGSVVRDGAFVMMGLRTFVDVDLVLRSRPPFARSGCGR